MFGKLFGKALEAQTRIAMVNTALTALGMWTLQIPGIGLLSLFTFVCRCGWGRGFGGSRGAQWWRLLPPILRAPQPLHAWLGCCTLGVLRTAGACHKIRPAAPALCCELCAAAPALCCELRATPGCPTRPSCCSHAPPPLLRRAPRSFIPIAGVIISTTPIGFVALTEYGFMRLALVILMVTGVHFVEVGAALEAEATLPGWRGNPGCPTRVVMLVGLLLHCLAPSDCASSCLALPCVLPRCISALGHDASAPRLRAAPSSAPASNTCWSAPSTPPTRAAPLSPCCHHVALPLLSTA